MRYESGRNPRSTPATSPFYVLGVDLGQVNDPTAIALIEHEFGRQPNFRVVHVRRFPLGTNYNEISDRIAARVNVKPLLGRTSVAVDATGVGKPVVDDLRPKVRGSRFHAITITAGNSVTNSPGNTNVRKRDLISTCQLLLQNGRLRIAATIPDAATLIEEMLAYRVTISESGHDSYGPWRERDHDDLLLALALAAWTAQNRSWRTARVYKPKGTLPRFSGRTRDAMYFTAPRDWTGF